MDSQNIQAIEDNYRGILALERKDPKAAQEHFERATKTDPFYKAAKANLEAVTVEVKGASLFAKALNELDAKEKQILAAREAVRELVGGYYRVKITGEPSIQTEASKPNVATISVPISISIDNQVVANFLDRVESLAGGDETQCIAFRSMGQHEKKCFKVHREVNEILAKSFNVSKRIVLMAGDEGFLAEDLVITGPSILRLTNERADVTNLEGRPVFQKYDISSHRRVLFKGISLDAIKEITGVVVQDKP